MWRCLGLDLSAIYALVDPRDDRVRYIGKANEPLRRLHLHVHPINLRGRNHKQQWIKSLIAVGLRPRLHVICWVPLEHWQEAERFWIAWWRRNYPGDLTNHCDGGQSNGNYRHTEASKAAIRAGLQRARDEGRWSGGITGYKFTDEQIVRLRKSHLGGPGNPGHRHSPESRAKIKAARARQEAEGRTRWHRAGAV